MINDANNAHHHHYVNKKLNPTPDPLMTHSPIINPIKMEEDVVDE